MRKRENLIGFRSGLLLVVKDLPPIDQKYYPLLCKCDCGNEVVLRAGNIKKQTTKSCGCLRKNKPKYYKNQFYNTWKAMIARCYNVNDIGYKRYGKRGIVVCEEWKNSFPSFRDWAVKHWKLGLSLDRINNGLGYGPDNCRYATIKQQQNNRSCNRRFTIEGVTKTMEEWSELKGIDSRTVRSRIFQRNWPVEKAFNTPVKKIA